MFARSQKILPVVVLAWFVAGLCRYGHAAAPDPQDAAVLYYQAFLVYQQPDDAMKPTVSDVAGGEAAPTDEFRQYIAKNRAAIDLAIAATRLDTCSWGVRYSEGFNALMPHLAQIRNLARLVICDARIMAMDGKAEPALVRCLAVRKMSRHVNDEILISYLVSVAMNSITDKAILDIAGSGQLSAAKLRQTKGILESMSGGKDAIRRAMAVEKDVALKSMTADRIGELVQAGGASGAEDIHKKLQEAGGEEFLTRCRKHYSDFIDAMTRIMTSDMPYAEGYAAMDKLVKDLEAATDEPSAVLTRLLGASIQKVYSMQMRDQGRVNAHLAALEILAVTAETGQLPPALPTGLPKDIYSGKDFLYGKTSQGFVLTANAKDLDKDIVQKYEFKVAR